MTSGITLFVSSLSRYDTSPFTCRVGMYIDRRPTAIKRPLALRASSGIISWSTSLLCLGTITCRRCSTATCTRREYRGSLPTIPGNPPRSIDFVRRRTLYLRPTYPASLLPRDLHSVRRKYKGRRYPRARLHSPERGKERSAEKNPFDTLTPATNRFHRLLNNYTDDNKISITAAMRIS